MKISSVSADQQITTSITSLCKQWRENRDDHLPGICQHLMTNEDDHLPITIIPGKSYFSPIQHQSDSLATERNLSIAGVLAGLLFILLVIAALLRIRARNNKKVRMRNQAEMFKSFPPTYANLTLTFLTCKVAMVSFWRSHALLCIMRYICAGA